MFQLVIPDSTMVVVRNAKTILTTLILFSILQTIHGNAAENKEKLTASMIDNWKHEKYSKLDPKLAKVNSWFNYGCVSHRLSPRVSKQVVRQEYRTLTSKQRYLFHSCLKVMLESPAVLPFWDQNEYESFITQHKFQFSPEAHGTPAFAPYHRAMLYFFEKVMHSHPGCENVGIPYWDSTLDSYLPDPSMSAMFTGRTYMGSTHGEVNGNLFTNWQKIKIKACQFYGETLSRDMCRDPDQMLKDEMIDRFINCHNYTACVFPHDKSFEEHHGLIHGCVKGHMAELMCAPYDPIFYLHHSFIDNIFEQWLTQHFPDVEKDDPTLAYPPDEDIEEYYNRGSAPMRPWDKSGYKVKDGMSRNFTRDFYWYAPRPHKCVEDRDCMSKMIWCDVEMGRCKAKAGEGGSCEGLPDKACYCSWRKFSHCSKANKTCECLDTKVTEWLFSAFVSRTETTTTSSKPPSTSSSSLSPSSSHQHSQTSSTSSTSSVENSQTPFQSSSSQTYSSLLATLEPQPPSPFLYSLEPPLPPLLLPESLEPLPLPVLPPESPATTLPPPTKPSSCRKDSECGKDEWCDGDCRKKIPLGGYCGANSSRVCSADKTISNSTKTLRTCRKNIEIPRCLFGKCICRLKAIKCNLESDCPKDLFCFSRLNLCVPKSRPKKRCVVSNPFDSCGFCKRRYSGVCLKKVGRCYCVRKRTWYHLKHDW